MEIVTDWCDVNGARLAYVRGGEGEVVILVHGALADGWMWEAHMRLLAKDYDVIALTLRHFGEAGTAEGGFGIETHAQDLRAFVKQVVGRPVRVVGWSYGASVVLNAAVQEPELFVRVLAYELGYAGYLSEAEMEVYGADASEMFGPIFALAEEEKWAEAVRVLIDGSGNAAGYFDGLPEGLQAQLLGKAHTLPQQLNQTERPVALSVEGLSACAVPVVAAFGEETRPLFRVVTAAAGRLLANGRVVAVAGANHMLPMEDPAGFVELVKEHIV